MRESGSVSEGETPSPSEQALREANLEPERLATLIALGEGLAAIGRLRKGQRAGQFALHNFLVRAAYESTAEGEPEALVILMRAGVFRRHTWFLHVRGQGEALDLVLPRAVEQGWEWWRDIEEVRDRLADGEAWNEAVGRPFVEAQREQRRRLSQARVQVGKRAEGAG